MLIIDFEYLPVIYDYVIELTLHYLNAIIINFLAINKTSYVQTKLYIYT